MSLAISSIGESDEDFARRLQAEEMGIAFQMSRPINNSPHRPSHDSSTPLMSGNSRYMRAGRLILPIIGYNNISSIASSGEPSRVVNNINTSSTTINNINNGTNNVNNNNSNNIGNLNNREMQNAPGDLNATLRELAASRISFIAVSIISTPQIIAAIIILFLYWNDNSVCTAVVRTKWNWWALIACMRLICCLLVVTMFYFFRTFLERNERLHYYMRHFRNWVDIFGLVWFLIGNIWIFGDNGSNCSNPSSSPVYNLCFSMLVVTMVQASMPCIISICFIPVLCCCMPCLIRFLVRVQNMHAPKGATEEIINTLPIVNVTDEQLTDEKTCPVCLNDMEVGDEARLLPCKHLFHMQCVDEWLKVNASCPTCRTSIIGNLNSEETKNGDEDSNLNSNIENADIRDSNNASSSSSSGSMSSSSMITGATRMSPDRGIAYLELPTDATP